MLPFSFDFKTQEAFKFGRKSYVLSLELAYSESCISASDDTD